MSRLIFICFLGIILLFIGCQRGDNIIDTQTNGDGASVTFSFEKPTSLDTLVIFAKAMVSAPDMDTITVNLTVNPNSVEGTIENIPAGPHRKFEIFTYNADTMLTYYGHAFSDVPAGQVITLQITLYPVNHNGTVIIIGTFAPFPPSGGKIVFESDYNGAYDIYIMNPDGSNLINLTNSSTTDDLRPRFSPDGQKILFTKRYSNGLHKVFVMDGDGGNLNELSILLGMNVTGGDWSPDMSKIVVRAGFPVSDNIYIYNMNTNQTTQLTFDISTKAIPFWSPDGNWIGYQSTETGITKIYMIHPDGSNKHLIVPSSGLEEKRPQFSPNGTKILFYGRTFSTWDLFVVNFDGSNLIQLTNTSGINENHQCWSPDGNKILFVRNDGSSGNGIYIMNPDGTGIEQILDTPNNEDHPHWR